MINSLELGLFEGYRVRRTNLPSAQKWTLTNNPSNVNLNRKILKNIPLSDSCKQIILGSLLGDGSLKIHKNYKNARFKFRHSEVQQEYFTWKAKMLQEISSEKSIISQKSDGFSRNKKLLYQSRALPSLTTIYNQTHSKNKLEIKRKWLNHLDRLSLAIWWLDDGSLISGRRKGVLCTDSFSKKSVNLLQKYLNVVWGVNVRVAPVFGKHKTLAKRQEYWRLWFSTTELLKFLRIILPYIPVQSCIPKVMVRYKDIKLQQRWISEIKAALPQMEVKTDF